MANQITINIGAAANDGTGDPLRTAFNDVNLNFANVWNTGLPSSNIQFSNNRILTTNTNANLVLAPNGIGVVQANVDIVPSINRGQSLGSTSKKWNTVNAYYLNANVANIASFGNLTFSTSNLHILGGSNGYFLQTDGTGNLTWSAPGGSGNGEVGGANTQVQYNNAGNFGGSPNFTFDNTTNILTVNGNISGSYFIGDGSRLTNLPVANTGNIGFTGDAIYDLNGLILENADLTHGATAAIILPSNGNTSVPIQVNNTYGNITLGTGPSSAITSTWTFTTSGNLTLPSNAANINYANGVSILNGVASNYGNSNVAAFLTTYTGNLSAGNASISNLTASHDIYATHGSFSGDSPTGDGALYVGSPTYTDLGTDVMAQFTGNVFGYGQINFQNYGNSPQSSGDYIVTADNGNDTTHFVDMGIAGSNWNGTQTNSLGNAISAGDGYLYVQDGNLALGVRTGASTQKVWKLDSTGNLTTAGTILVGPGNKGIASWDANSMGIVTDFASDLTGIYLAKNDQAQIYANATVQIYTDTGNTGRLWAFNTDGTLTVPLSPLGASNQLKYGTGNLVVWNDGGWTIGEYNGTNLGTEGIRIDPGIEGQTGMQFPGSLNANTQPVQIYNTAGGNIQLYSGNSSTWTFSIDGSLNLPSPGTVRGGNGPVNLASNNFVQLQWVDSGNINIADPNNTGGPTNWAYIDSNSFNVELGVNTGAANVHGWYFTNTGNLNTNSGNLKTTSNVITTHSFVGTSLRTNLGDFNWSESISGITEGANTYINLAHNVFGDPWTGQVTITGVVGPTEVNATWYYQATNSNQFEIFSDAGLTTPVDSSAWAGYVSGGVATTIGYDDLSIIGKSITLRVDHGDYNNRIWRFDQSGQTIFPYQDVVRGDVSGGNITGYAMVMGDGTGEAIISTPNAGSGQYNSQRLVINPGKGEDGTSGEGGDIYLWAGRGGSTNGNGGDVKIRGGYGPGDGQGGYIRIEAGDVQGSGTPGYVYHRGGDVNVGTGGYVQSQGGQGSIGGYINLTGGYGTDGPGGNVTISGGQAAGGLTYYGNVVINAGASSWAFDNTGNLQVPPTGYVTAPAAASGSAGYNVNIQAGASDAVTWNSNPGGNLNLTGGYGSFADGGGGAGGQVNITGGSSSDNVGGNVNIAGGAGVGANGYILLNSTTFDPPVNNGGGAGESAVIHGTRRIIGGVDNPVWQLAATLPNNSPTVVYTTGSYAYSAKITFVVQSNNATFGWEQFDVAVIRLQAGGVGVTVSNRMNNNPANGDTQVTAAINGFNRIEISLAQPGSGTAYVNYDAVEFNLMVD